MKKVLALLLATIMCASLCACGSSTGTTSSGNTAQSTKGTKKDPYNLGDEITFTSCNMGEDHQFKVRLKIKELTEEENAQAISLREKMHDGSHKYLGLELLLESEDGSYSDSIQGGTTSAGFPLIKAYTDSMSETYFNYFTHDSRDNIYDFYADVNYDLYMVYADDNDYTMLSVEYRTGAYETTTIWISLQ